MSDKPAFRGRVYDDITQTIGATPLVRLRRVVGDAKAIVVAKLENFNPLWSVKDRIGVAMIRPPSATARSSPGITVIEPTSGNTGIGLAFTCAARGYKLIVTMPDTHEPGTPAPAQGVRGRGRADAGRTRHEGRHREGQRVAEEPRRIHLFRSNSTTRPTRRSTARRRPRKSGTTRTARWTFWCRASALAAPSPACSEVIKPRKPSFKAIAVEPTASPVISQKLHGEELKPGRHKIQGLGAGFIPTVLNLKIIDEVVLVNDDDSFKMGRRLAREEGMLAGISCGAAVHAAVQVAQRPEYAGKLIVVVLPDLGERYLSTALYPE